MTTTNAGKCNWTGDYFLACRCDSGIFTLEEGPLPRDTNCTKCRHTSADHEPIGVSTGASPFPEIPIAQQLELRSTTCEKLFSVLRKSRLVHVRGTPASGKSSLGKIFANHINRRHAEHGKMACYLTADKLPDGVTRLEWLQERVSEKTVPKRSFANIDYMPDLFIILDEGQLTYGDAVFWEMLKDEKPGIGTHYLILCAWGSPTRFPNDIKFYGSNLTLLPEQRIGFCHDRVSISMFFSREEHRAAIENMTTDHSLWNPRRYSLSPSILEYLYFLTNGHPGATSATFRLLLDAWTNAPNDSGSEIIHDFAKQLFEDRAFVPSKLSLTDQCGRGFYTLDHIDGEVKKRVPETSSTLVRKILQGVLTRGQAVESFESKSSETENPVLNAIYHTGVLQSELEMDTSERVVYVFPTQFHKRYYEYQLQPGLPLFPYDKVRSLQNLLVQTITLFSSTTIRNRANHVARLGAGAKPRYPEAVYRDELYRCLYDFLGGDFTQSEWSGPDSNCRIDFRVVAGPDWKLKQDADENLTVKLPYGIKCSRGSRLLEYVQRFEPGGDYWSYIQDGLLRDYALLDFRMIEPGGATPDLTKLPGQSFIYYVMFLPESAGVRVEIYNKGSLLNEGWTQP